jgi:hypothetical protein
LSNLKSSPPKKTKAEIAKEWYDKHMQLHPDAPEIYLYKGVLCSREELMMLWGADTGEAERIQ